MTELSIFYKEYCTVKSDVMAFRLSTSISLVDIVKLFVSENFTPDYISLRLGFVRLLRGDAVQYYHGAFG
jgi:hypothetical protein